MFYPAVDTPANTAVWLTAGRVGFEVRPAPYTRPRTNEIVVRNRAVAVNPVDWMMPLVGPVVFPWIKYPAVLGSDVAGDVVEVGSGVSHRPGRAPIPMAVFEPSEETATCPNSSRRECARKWTVTSWCF